MLTLMLSLALFSTQSPPRAVAPTTAVELLGAWRPDAYVLKDGTELTVDGHIFFTERDWTVLFFVIEDDEPRRGSAEGGTYRVEGDRLEFRHHYHLSVGDAVGSLAEAPLRMSVVTAEEAAREPCRIELDGPTLTLHFPSGNRMRFQRR